MWEMSKIPTLVRTAVCSSMMEEYWTGMFQPAKGTRRAPRAWWAPSSGERFKSDITQATLKVARGLSIRANPRADVSAISRT